MLISVNLVDLFNNSNFSVLNKTQILKHNLLEHTFFNNILIPHSNFMKVGHILGIKFARDYIDNTYFFLGLLIGIHNNFISSSIILRNVISLYTLEYTFFLYSPMILLGFSNYITPILYNKNKFLFLRRKAAPLSFFRFNYKFYI